MNKRKVLALFIVLLFSSFCLCLCGFSFFKKKAKNNLEVVKTQEILRYNSTQNNVWCVTFQLVWNELLDKFVKAPVVFEGGNTPLVDELNKKLYTADILSENSYYTVFGKISNKLKRDIEKSIYKKFKEKSDILDMINWNAKDSYLFYSILCKNFTFISAFDRLSSDSFYNSNEKVKYFGIHEKSNKKLKENVSVLFYNSPDEYAIKLRTAEKEDVILYRTDKQDTFINYFDYISNKSEFSSFLEKDELKIPDINLDKTISYDELCGKKIQGTEYVISQALQTIKFKMDNKGGSLKSEAAIAIMRTSLLPPVQQERKFFFDKPFVLFLIEEGKDKPYYAMKVDNIEYLVKE